MPLEGGGGKGGEVYTFYPWRGMKRRRKEMDYEGRGKRNSSFFTGRKKNPAGFAAKVGKRGYRRGKRSHRSVEREERGERNCIDFSTLEEGTLGHVRLRLREGLGTRGVSTCRKVKERVLNFYTLLIEKRGREKRDNFGLSVPEPIQQPFPQGWGRESQFHSRRKEKKKKKTQSSPVGENESDSNVGKRENEV